MERPVPPTTSLPNFEPALPAPPFPTEEPSLPADVSQRSDERTSTATITLVLPCFNPHAGWGAQAAQRLSALRAQSPGWAWTLVVVDDGSTRGVESGELDSLPDCQVIHTGRNVGKGAALRAALAASAGSLHLLTDCDLPYDDASMLRVAEALVAAPDCLVAGQRDVVQRAGASRTRLLVSSLLRVANRVVLRLPHSDTQCGLKGLGPAARELFLRTMAPGFVCDIELFVRAMRAGAPAIRAVPVQLHHLGTPSPLRWRILWREIRWLWRVYWERDAT